MSGRLPYHGHVGNSIKLGHIFGVEIGVHWSWIFIFFIVTWSFANGIFHQFYPEWSDRAALGGRRPRRRLFFLSVLLHELSHAIVSNKNGLPVRQITLFVFGGVAISRRSLTTARAGVHIASSVR